MNPWKIGALILFIAAVTDEGRKILRNITKETMRIAYRTLDKGSYVFSDARDVIAELVDEVKAERSEKDGAHSKG